MFVYIGTYTTKFPHVPDAKGKGIYLFKLDQDTGILAKAREEPFASGENPTFVAVTKCGSWLYAVSEGDASSITGFKVDKSSGELVKIGAWPTNGKDGCHVSVTPDDKFVLCANYASGSAMSFAIDHSNGHLRPRQSHQYTHVSGYNPVRQEAPHAHCNVPSHDGTRAYVADLGGDRIYKYSVHPQTGQLTLPTNGSPFVATPNGTGPRHIAVHPSATHLYVVGELNHQVLVFAISPQDGALELQQQIESLPPTLKSVEGSESGGKCGPPEFPYCMSADIHLTPDSRFLYMSNRFENGIAGFTVDPLTKLLTRLPNHVHPKGEIPRNFFITPNGKFMIVANQDSHNLVSFKIDPGTGELEYTGHQVECPSPVCIAPLLPGRSD